MIEPADWLASHRIPKASGLVSAGYNAAAVWAKGSCLYGSVMLSHLFKRCRLGQVPEEYITLLAARQPRLAVRAQRYQKHRLLMLKGIARFFARACVPQLSDLFLLRSGQGPVAIRANGSR